jgi:hypothetical protein
VLLELAVFKLTPFSPSIMLELFDGVVALVASVVGVLILAEVEV